MSKRYGANGQTYIGPPQVEEEVKVILSPVKPEPVKKPEPIKISWEGVDAEPSK